MKCNAFLMMLLSYAVIYTSCHPKLTSHQSDQSAQSQQSEQSGQSAQSGQSTQYQQPEQSQQSQPTTLNKEVKDDRGNLNLLGVCTRERLQQAPFDSWFVKEYTSYTVDTLTAGQLQGKLAGRTLRIFMGTWCGDSQMQVPRIFKILDYCGVKPSSIQLIMVSDADSSYKQSPGHEEKGLNIFRVPDLLVLDHGRESGRIVESPVQSLEKDLLAITSGQPYTPKYTGAAFLIRLFGERNKKDIENDLPAIAGQIKPLLQSPGELKSYAHVMNAAGEKEKAGIALRLNSLIFPSIKPIPQ